MEQIIEDIKRLRAQTRFQRLKSFMNDPEQIKGYKAQVDDALVYFNVRDYTLLT